MKVFIVSDLEGVSGVTNPGQIVGGSPMYEESRRLYTEEMNAAVRGAKAAGATEIVVMDCHGAGGGWSFNSLVHDLLDPDCEYVVQEEWTSTFAPSAANSLAQAAPIPPDAPVTTTPLPARPVSMEVP